MQGTYLHSLPKDLRQELIRFGGYWPTYLELLPPELAKILESYNDVLFGARIEKGRYEPRIYLENLTILEPGKPPLVIPIFDTNATAFYGILAGLYSLSSGDTMISAGTRLRIEHRGYIYIFSEQTRKIFRTKVARVILDLAGDYLEAHYPRRKEFFERIAKGEDDV